jgi:hypothetical protein
MLPNPAHNKISEFFKIFVLEKIRNLWLQFLSKPEKIVNFD